MPRLLDRMPFPAMSGELVVRGERIRVRSDQILAWISLSPQRQTVPNPTTVPFPAILDTGHNHSFSISEQHSLEWAGLNAEALHVRGAVRDRGRRVALRLANVWIHPNEKGRRELLAGGTPSLLTTRTGIAVYPGGDFPRLPILGLRTIAENQLVLTVDGANREATLWSQYRWWLRFLPLSSLRFSPAVDRRDPRVR